ncbi:endonuclease/exonuclease/phosphatase family protein [Rubrivirga sp. S365]|uniref:Endonuclease/exonuclease/phosphatase family protein n=1 Tax=Rubrivirga litoralis TaxID=3075598 RepID=A0ABU3BP20_9BACT|nr:MULTISPECIES: endonuclease/exonuclease/phosphatase family protein [unclassified Rubrivirga]MDT0631008.1 endonuclease/exonuclease/phosphatase family protein [Rubrivirga sp. F394]MDT7855034.1 endonuclease/exonuclease/phosphatase family protein [Rubrivirga sp. S365]
MPAAPPQQSPRRWGRGRGGPRALDGATTPPRSTRSLRLWAGWTLAALCLLATLAPLRAEAQAPDTLVVVTLNIWHDQGDWPARLDLIERDLRALRPDVVFLQEVLQKEGLPNQARTIADRLGFAHVHFVSVDSAGAPKRYGNAILSAHPFAETAERRLPPLDAFRTAAYAQIEVGGRPVRLYTTHLHHPATPEGRGVRAMEIAHLLDFVASTGGDAPLVLGGDFNAEPSWPEMRMLGGLRDLGGAGITWGPPYAGAAGRRIDYLFDAADARLVPVAAGVALDRPARDGDGAGAGRYPSDHFAVFARFLLP